MANDKQDRLIGDVTSDIIRAVRADRVAKAYSRITGKPGCTSCKHRQMRLNELHQKLKQKATERRQRIVELLSPNKSD